LPSGSDPPSSSMGMKPRGAKTPPLAAEMELWGAAAC
jgi:hypothetical protein